MSRFWLPLLVLFSLTGPVAGQTPEPTTRELAITIGERDRSYGQRFDAQEKAVAAALAAAKEAVAKAEIAVEKRLEGVNEFRGTLKDQQATLMPRSEVVATLKAMDEKIQNIDVRLSQLISRSEGVNWLWGVLAAALGLLAGIVVAVVALRKAPVLTRK